MRSASFAGFIEEHRDERPDPETFVTSQTDLIPVATRFPELTLSFFPGSQNCVAAIRGLRSGCFPDSGVSLCVLSGQNDVTSRVL